MEKIEEHLCFGGQQQRWLHHSDILNCDMRFSIFIPPKREGVAPPALWWLSGLTCTDENFTTKAGAQRVAAELGIALIMPDTSPRGSGIADDESYDLGQGAGFYINATQAPWSEHYRMYDYLTDELPALIAKHFELSGRFAISGHSMGGHGALMIALKNPARFVSASAFAPISNPVEAPWGIKAFQAYLGDDKQQWKLWDSAELLKQAAQSDSFPILIDYGSADPFLEQQLMPESLATAANQSHWPVTIRTQPGYDHSYFFIATFIEEHLRFHARYLFKR